MTEAPQQLLVVEDDPNLGLLLLDFLQDQGFGVRLCKDGESGWKAFRDGVFDACVIDVMLPKKDGFTLATQIRAQNKIVPLIFLTARSMKEDKLNAFGIGADDYITKPFDEEELVARIRAVIRRTTKPATQELPEQITLGDYVLDVHNLSLIRGNDTRRITEREAALLLHLAQQPNKLLRREDILTCVWGKDDYFLGRSLDVFITKLRKYLKDDPRIRIENVHGVGFIFHNS